MSRNTQIEMLARVIALMAADGDADKAEEIIAWATATPMTAEKKPRDRTTSFTKRYLTPYAPYDNEKLERFIRLAIVNKPLHVDMERVKKTIDNMQYQDFLNTIYWRGVSLYVKRRDGWKCTKCGSTKNLAVHHKIYGNHGAETEHLGDLTTLCKSCHDGAHGKQQEKRITAKDIIFAAMEPGKTYTSNELSAYVENPNTGRTAIQALKSEGRIEKVDDRHWVQKRRGPKTGSALSIADLFAKANEIEDGWNILIKRYAYNNHARLAMMLERSTMTHHEEGEKQIIVFTAEKEVQAKWMEEKYLQDMERELKDILGRKDIELRVKVNPS